MASAPAITERGRGRGTGRGRSAGRKPVQKRTNTAISSPTTQTPQRSTAEVQAEREEAQRIAEVVEVDRLQKVATLAAYEDSAQRKTAEYNINFAHPLRLASATPKTPNATLRSKNLDGTPHKQSTPTPGAPRLASSITPTKTPEGIASELEELYRRLAELEKEKNVESQGAEIQQAEDIDMGIDGPGPEVEVQDDSVEKPAPDSTLALPEAPTKVKKWTRGAPQTSHSDVNNARGTIPSVQSIHKAASSRIPSQVTTGETTKKCKIPSDGGEKPIQEGKRSKKSKKPTGPPVTSQASRLKKNKRAAKVGREETITDTMLQEVRGLVLTMIKLLLWQSASKQGVTYR
ncbi:hypothetical protein PM082_011434 [Marasmius tenuissimus]|nr:hypothetical protein PM082_011434 [Marasmius tenuissimus]